MKKRSVLVSVSASALVVAGLTPTVTAYASPQPRSPAISSLTTPKSSSRVGPAGSFDAREGQSRQARNLIANAALRATARPAVRALSASLGNQAVIDMDGTTGTPRIVAKLNGFLTAPSRRPAAAIALGYVRSHPGVFRLTKSDFRGLRLTRDYVDIEGASHLFWAQTVHGVPLFDNGLRANVARNGQLINVEGSPVSNLRAPAAPASLTPRQAIVAAKANLGSASTAPEPGDVAKHVLFAVDGHSVAAYLVTAMSVTTPSLLVVDARSGRVLFRESITADANAKKNDGQRALVYRNYPRAPRGGEPVVVDLTKKGWLPAGSSVLFGNNVHTYTDINDNNFADPSEEVAPQQDGSYEFKQHRFFGVPHEPCVKFNCTWRPNQPFSWRRNRPQTAVQNFYFINNYHDHLLRAPIGFTEAAGNFQEVNHTGKGKGGDPVQDQPLDGANVDHGLPDGQHIDNANFATPPDGQAPTMQMYLFHQPHLKYPDKDPFLAVAGSDEADIVYHEYTHGLSHRLVVDASDVPALDSQQGASMGEAWSDWYAMDYLVGQHLVANGPKPDVEVGRYVDGPLHDLVRTEQIDCQVHSPKKFCPGTPGAGSGGYTYGDFGKIIGFPEVHADGEIWGQTLWDLRDALGSKRTEAIVTRGMELSPTFPSYLDMRNAIIQADMADFHGKDVHTIWTVFAHRGMGFFAGTVTGDDVQPVQDFHMPPGPHAQKGSVSGKVIDSVTGKPVKGAIVAFGGHDSGFPGSYVAKTKADGKYSIKNVFVGTYPDVFAAGAGYNVQIVRLHIPAGHLARNFRLVRDWAAASGGASIVASNGNDGVPFGCGPQQLIDQQLTIGWSTLKPPSGGKFATIKLPRPVDIQSLQIDPSGTCGDDLVASADQYTVETSTDGNTFVPAASGTFTPSDTGHLTTVTLAPGTGTGVQYIRYTILSNQAAERGIDCSSPSNDEGCPWFDSQELEVFGAPSG